MASAFIIMFSVAEKFGSTPGSSIRAPMREGAPEKLPATCERSSPNSASCPALGVASPAIIFIVVDLPAPFLPTKP